ncbi:PAS domain-containing sensor histidine kinase [Pedobacter faecalis]|uniref:PAS domain-containing sensor histidine kinase n=1 Tax=Pedobacter faecalis TaxID=3041495 RepID=UPI0025515F15|nr:PAS domain-containing sensor histidine kinase [Pedobacter sp. ELA7]
MTINLNARPDFKHHLEITQRLGQIGSWELDLNNSDPEAPQYWSDETYRILGYEPGEAKPCYRTFMNSIHPDDYDNVLEASALSIKEGREYDMEQRHITPDGRIVVTRSVAQVIRDQKTGQPLKLCGAMKDITEENEAREALERVNRDLSIFFQKVDEVLYSVDMQQYAVLQMSPACERVYGYTVAEMTENPLRWFEVILDEDKHIIHESDPVMRRGEIVTNEYRIRHKDGSIRWIWGTLTPTLDDSGNLLRIDGVCADISARKNAELALMNSELKFRTMLENSSDGVAVTDGNWQLTFASSSMLRITGYSAEDLLHTNVSALVHPDDLEALLEVRDNLMKKTAGTTQYTARIRQKSGKWIWLEGVSQNLLHEPAVNGFVTNFRDVTERLSHEEALKSANRDLKKTNDELDRFVYSVSHDLRAPLASLLGAIEFTETETDDPEILENLSMMKFSVQKLDGFILDILDYSRNSRLEVKSGPVDLEQMLSETVKNLKFMSQDNGQVDVRLNIRGQAILHSDSSRLNTILNNLISNAIRYHNPAAEDPFVLVDVSIGPHEATIRIADNGMGIDPKYHDKVFDMFYRVSKKSVGSGLGLYIVKEAVDKLNGSITLKSEPGRGTEFLLKVPNLNNVQSA